MSELRRARIHVTGIVQGVGFRPFVYGLAVRYALAGWVRNTSSGVDIEVDGSPASLESFLVALKNELPPLARLDSLSVDWREAGGFTGFEIHPSQVVPGAFQPISPDVSICPDCLRELFDPHNRRFRYPFINCTNCGPRFTIITDIPYDRPNTTMAPFAMCPDCASEYQDPLNRRFHAQPVACPVCGPQVWLETTGIWKPEMEREFAICQAQRLLADGRILAVKGLGGFHLACDAANSQAVELLRHRKLRVDKPFALMLPDIAAVEMHCMVSEVERVLLTSRSRPIVLLKRQPGSRIVSEVAPHQDQLGVMLPYTPLHYLLMVDEELKSSNAFPSHPGHRALVMTSANLSEEPIASSNAEARERLAGLADAFLMHDRDIRTRCDDSVVRVFTLPEIGSPAANDKPRLKVEPVHSSYFLRRSRGYAPDPISLPFDVLPLLAAGPELKNTFCLTRQRYAFLSHHIGDMENYETLRSFEDGIEHFERLFRIKPEAIACDLHPDYLSTRYAQARAERENLPLFAVQHHHAHIAACMVDQGLDGTRPVIGLAFDGTGYGSDAAIWGGEILLADYAGFKRPYHLAYFPLPGGNAAIQRPARTALALLWSLGMEWESFLPSVQDLCSEERQALRTQLERGLNSPQTSSLGRLFDAVASLTGVRQKVNFEAQAAIEFEACADPDETGSYRFEFGEETIDPAPVIRAVLEDLHAGLPVSSISARFHRGVAGMVCQACLALHRSTGISEVVLSGGVWQNMFLLEQVVHSLRVEGFQVYIHRQLPANDGGLALGQALVAAVRLRASPPSEF